MGIGAVGLYSLTVPSSRTGRVLIIGTPPQYVKLDFGFFLDSTLSLIVKGERCCRAREILQYRLW